MKPIADDSGRSMAGMAGTKDKLLKMLAEEDATEWELQRVAAMVLDK